MSSLAAMFSYLLYRSTFQTIKKVNALLYYCQKIPWLGASIPETVYQHYSLKQVLHYLIRLTSIPLAILLKIVWLLLYHGLAILILALMDKNTPDTTYLLGFLLWFFLIGLSLSPSVFQAEDRELLTVMPLSLRPIFFANILLVPLLHSLYYLPGCILLALISKQIWLIPLGLLALPTSQISNLALQRLLYLSDKTRGWFDLLNQFKLLISLALAIGSFLLLRETILPLGLLIQVIILLGGLLLIIKRKINEDLISHLYRQSIQAELEIDNLLANTDVQDGAQLQEGLSLQPGKDLSHLTGMTYLNALLFQRYQPLLRKKLIFRLLFLGGGLAFVEIMGLLGHSFNLTRDQTWQPILPLFFMLLYLTSMGHLITQTLFINCDIAMLHYPFYREPDTLLAGFHYRFLKILTYNGGFSLALMLAVLISSRGQLSFSLYLLTALLLTSLTALFSFHHLFLYYILQPFTKDKQIVRPLYTFLRGLLYWISWLHTKIQLSGYLYLTAFSFFVMIYLLIGYYLVRKKGPETFRLRA